MYPTEEEGCELGGYNNQNRFQDFGQTNSAHNEADDFGLNLSLENLNVTSEDIDFDEIDEDLEQFQEDEMVKQALQRGIDLKKYGQELAIQLKDAETESVQQYMDNSVQVVELHTQMESCDAVLARMQEMLLGFQADLGGISEEIKHLQDESMTMSIKLKNRRIAEELIRNFLENINMEPEIASIINTSTINEEFLEAAVDLSKTLKFLKLSGPPKDGSTLDLIPSDTNCGKTLLPELEKLKIRVVVKCRDYFTSLFQAIRKPKTNVQMLQQNQLVRFSGLFQFLMQEAPLVADDVRNLYIEAMGKTLHNVFKNYYAQLIKLELVMANKNDQVAVEEANLKSMFSSKVDLSKRTDAFNLGERDKILDQIEAEPILVHVALAENHKYSYEVLLRSIVKHLSDAATSEFLFIYDFFGKTSSVDIFNRIFGRTLSMLLENLENYLLNSYDLIGLLLLIKITHAQYLVMQRRRVPVLDSFFDRISLLLWPRFKFVMDLNLKGLKNAVPKKLGSVDLTPHYISRRYAELVSSILTLHGGSKSFGIGGGGEQMLLVDLQLMRIEIIALLEKLTTLLPTSKERKVFLINNVDQMLSVFQERRVMSDEVQKLEDMLMQQRELFAEESLKGIFPHLVAFVVKTEQEITAAMKNSSQSKFSIDENAVESLVKEFAATWRTGIQQINDEVLSYFANFRNGMEILKQVLTQLLLYYTRFQDIVKKAWNRPPAFMRDIVNTSTILQEIKRYSRTF